jgi:hypothetical protein
MKEARELQTLIEQLERHVRLQASLIDSLQAKMRGALAALRTGAALDVVAAIEILRDKNET